MSVPADDVAFALRNVATGLYLSTTASYAGAEVVLENVPEGSAARWILQSHHSGQYLLNAADTTMCLNVAYESKAVGAKLQQWTCNEGLSEMWTIVPTSTGGWTLMNQNSRLMAGAAGSISGSAVIQKASADDPLAQWQVIPPDCPADPSNTIAAAAPATITNNTGIKDTLAETFADEMIYNIYTPLFSSDGNLAAITHDLSRITGLGFSSILLMPIHPIGVPFEDRPACGSPYAVADYYGIDPALGELSDFAKLMSEAHALGLKVIMDVVLNHTAWNHPFVVQHPEYYVHVSSNKNSSKSISQAFNFDDVAQLDFKTGPAVQKYMLTMLVWWMRNYSVDGFRFDTADNPYGKDRMIPAETWSFIGNNLKAVNPRVILLGECCNPELSLRPFNMDYANYSLQPAVVNATRTQNASNLPKVFSQLQSAHPTGMLHTSIMQNWDMDLDLNMYGGPDGTLCAAVFNFSVEGVPMLFAGEEVGNDRGGHNTHTPINWASSLASRFSAFYKSLGMLRRSHEALRKGETTWLACDGGAGLIAFTRKRESEEFFIAINFSASAVGGSASTRKSLFKKEILSSEGWTEVTPPGAAYAVPHPAPSTIRLGPWDFAIFCRHS
ncbi:glycoside hydrolase superfamily [Usnea florida]